MEDRLGAFPIGPVAGDDVVPIDPVEAMRGGRAHRVPLIVGTNAEEGRLFTRFLKMLPTNQTMIEELLADTEPAARERITAAYPDYPAPSACIQLGGDFAFGSAAWQIAEAHSAHAPTYLYRYDYAPRTLRWSGLGATHATELLAVFDVYRTRFGALLTAAADRRAALRVSNQVQRRWRAFSHSGAPGDDWPTYTTADRAVMVFDRKSRVEFDPHPAPPDCLGWLLPGAVTWHADPHACRYRASHRTTRRPHHRMAGNGDRRGTHRRFLR